MQCPACRYENPAQAKLCLECGARLVVTCPNCRAELPPSSKFCPECGQRVTLPGAATLSPSASPEAHTPRHLAERILAAKGAFEGERFLASPLADYVTGEVLAVNGGAFAGRMYLPLGTPKAR